MLGPFVILAPHSSPAPHSMLGQTPPRELVEKSGLRFSEAKKAGVLRLSSFYLTETLPRSFRSPDAESLFCEDLQLLFKQIADNIPDLRSSAPCTLTFFLLKALPLSRAGITRRWGADRRRPLDEGHLRPCSLESSGEESRHPRRTLPSGTGKGGVEWGSQSVSL